MPVLAFLFLIHRPHQAIRVGPATGVRVLRIVVRIAREDLPLAAEEELLEGDALEALGTDIGLEDTVFPRLPFGNHPAAD